MGNQAQKPGQPRRGYLRLSQRLVVLGLERLCELLDDIPRVTRLDGGFWDSTWRIERYGRYGCRYLNLIEVSKRLDERWSLGHWE